LAQSITILRPVEGELLREARLHELDVAAARVLHLLGAAKPVRGRHAPAVGAGEARLDPRLDLVGQLVAVRPEQLDAVVLERVVRGGDDHAKIGLERAGQHGDGRRRQGAEQDHVHAHGHEPGGQRRLQHVAGQPGVLADHDPVQMAAARELRAGRQRDPERGFRGHRLEVRRAADAVGAEEPARHRGSHRSGHCI
jgi:hypothetical protein